MFQSNGTTRRGHQPKLLEQVRDAIRARHYSLRTEEAYVQWIRRFILFHDKRHPQEMGAPEVQQFLTDLAVTHRVAAATQNQALSAILFLYKVVLQQDIGWIEDVVRAKKPKKLPVVLTRDEVKAVLQHVTGSTWIMASLLYGAGLRLMECLRLRVKDVDFAYHQITVRNGKGAHDRVTMLPSSVQEPLQRHLEAQFSVLLAQDPEVRRDYACLMQHGGGLHCSGSVHSRRAMNQRIRVPAQGVPSHVSARTQRRIWVRYHDVDSSVGKFDRTLSWLLQNAEGQGACTGKSD